jgi:hypothetical protein
MDDPKRFLLNERRRHDRVDFSKEPAALGDLEDLKGCHPDKVNRSLVVGQGSVKMDSEISELLRHRS